MSIVRVSKTEDENLIKSPTSSKYPWQSTPIGEGFFVPRTEFSKEDYRPSCPPALREKGFMFYSMKQTIYGVVGVAVIRES